MDTKPSALEERRREILAEMGRIPRVIAGKVTERQRAKAGGGKATYHQLQHWQSGRNATRHVSAARLAAVREGVEGHRRAETLLDELSSVDEAAVFGPTPDDSKKKPTRR